MPTGHHISVNQWRKDEGLEDEGEFMERLQVATFDGVCPALCDEGCEVEPDGTCEHGCPSILIRMGMV